MGESKSRAALLLCWVMWRMLSWQWALLTRLLSGLAGKPSCSVTQTHSFWRPDTRCINTHTCMHAFVHMAHSPHLAILFLSVNMWWLWVNNAHTMTSLNTFFEYRELFKWANQRTAVKPVHLNGSWEWPRTIYPAFVFVLSVLAFLIRPGLSQSLQTPGNSHDLVKIPQDLLL